MTTVRSIAGARATGGVANRSSARVRSLLCLLALLAAAPVAAVEHVVIVRDHVFSPAMLTIQPGDSVRWTNEGPSAHNVRADDNSFRCSDTCRDTDTGTGGYPSEPSGGDPSASAWSYSRTFNSVGELRYFCEAHGGPNGIGMSGRIVIAGDDPPPPSFAINVGVSGSWFNPVTTGQGLLLDVVPTTDPPLVAMAWFTFDIESGGPDHQRWYTGVGPYEEGGNVVQLTMFRSTGGIIDLGEPPVDTVETGTATLTFDSCTEGTFTYHLELPEGMLSNEVPIQRLTPADLCEALDEADPGS